MGFFSNRKRRVSLGPYPMEKLPRLAALPDLSGMTEPETGGPDDSAPQSLTAGMIPQIRLYETVRDGKTAPEKAPLPDDPRQLSHNLKATCYFLDADMVGIAPLDADAWKPDAWRSASAVKNGGDDAVGAHPEHSHAIVILVGHGREPRPGTLEAGWIGGTQAQRAHMRGMEIATVVAGYIRSLGHDARAHSPREGEVNQARLTIAAGLGWWREAGRRGAPGEVVNPFLGPCFHTAVVTTNLPLAPDSPLRPRGPLFRLSPTWLGWWVGAGGVRPGWKRLRGDHRPLHLSRYPMERVKRRDTPTTLISGDVPRVPYRGAFFTRALYGDMGEKYKTERNRFAVKHPLTQGMVPLIRGLVPNQDGETAERITPGYAHPGRNAQAVKAACYYLDMDLVGICEAPAFAWYSHGNKGQPIEPDHRYAVVMLIDQGYETMEGASGDDWISGAQSMRAYMRGAQVTNTLAAHIRALGYSARAHTNSLSDVLHIPLVLLAGLGEMSRIGELVLNPFVGPRFKSAVVTTNMPLTPDKPIDFGLQDFCEKCHKCDRECPCQAIPAGDKIMFNGYEIWKTDAEKCAK